MTSAALYQNLQIRQLEKIATEQFGMTEIALMRQAGDSVWHTIKQDYPKAQRILIICGKGNNAGDGFIVAKQAITAGLNISVWLVIKPDRLSNSAKLAYQQIQSLAINFLDSQPNSDDFDLIIDGLLGIGLIGDVRECYQPIINWINAAKLPVVAIDVPSGLSADTGMPQGVAVKADITVTMLGLKLGLFTGEGKTYAGKITLANIALPAQIYALVKPVAQLLPGQAVLPRREPHQHKGEFGHVLLIAGGEGMPGAALLAARAAFTVGAGLVTVITHPSNVSPLIDAQPEVMCHDGAQLDSVTDLVNKASVVLLGPGLGQQPWVDAMIEGLVDSQKPLVIDADGLQYVKRFPTPQKILTPHPGEAGQLLGLSATDIQANRLDAIHQIAQQYHAKVILKGSGTLLLDEADTVLVNQTGNALLATAGSGDVLAGMIAGLIAQGQALGDAMKTAVILHGQAADLALTKDGEIGFTASSLFDYIKQVG